MTSSPLEPEKYDCVAIVTNHSSIDYADLVERGKVIVDFRNATKGHEVDGKVWKLRRSCRVGMALRPRRDSPAPGCRPLPACTRDDRARRSALRRHARCGRHR